jgi:hypothetical protein
VRTRFLVAAVVASFGLAACSNGSSALPGASSQFSNANAGSSLKFAIAGVPLAQCPTSKYIGCITLAKGHPVKYTICITSGTSCNSGSFPKEKWSSKITTVKGKPFTGIGATFKPNPGNPTKGTVTAKVKLKNSDGKVAFVQAVKACPTKGGSCITNDIGIVAK